MAADPYGDSASQVLPQSDGSAWVVGGQQSGSPPSCRLMRATTGALELVQQEAGCVALSVADDAVVTVRQIQALNTYRVRTEKFLADGTRAWSRDSAATGGSWLKLARGANGAVHVATTTRDTPRIAVISYAADGTSLPEVRRQRTFVVVRIAPAGERTSRVTLHHTGWGSGGEWDRAYAYFDRAWGNVLANLRKRFETGPMDWTDWLAQLKKMRDDAAKNREDAAATRK